MVRLNGGDHGLEVHAQTFDHHLRGGVLGPCGEILNVGKEHGNVLAFAYQREAGRIAQNALDHIVVDIAFEHGA